MNLMKLASTFLLVAAAVAQGAESDKISAVLAAKISKLEREAHPIGTILQSIVPEATFQKAYGTEWVVMRGQAVTDSKLCQLFSVCQLPNAEGTFLRTQGPGNPNLRERQESSLPNHSHALSNSGGAAIMFYGNSGAGFSDIWIQSNGPDVDYTSNGSNAGGVNGRGNLRAPSAGLVGRTEGMNPTSGEVRPPNITVQTYIRIN